MIKITFNELVELNGKEIKEVFSYEEPTEREKGIININSTTVFNCFRNEVTSNKSFAIIHFYDKKNNEVANLSIFNKENEGLIIKDSDNIYSETSLRILNMHNDSLEK